MRYSLGSAVLLMAIFLSAFGSKCPKRENTVKKFQVIEEQLNWYAALLNCSSQGMNLATINSQEENNMLVNQLKRLYPKDIYLMSWWIGAANLHDVEKFIWFSTGEPIEYKNFHPGEPHSIYMADMGRCVEIQYANLHNLSEYAWNYDWNDTNCKYYRQFICEYFESI